MPWGSQRVSSELTSSERRLAHLKEGGQHDRNEEGVHEREGDALRHL